MSTESKPGTDMVFATASLKDRMDWSRAIAGAGNLVPAGFRDGPNANPAKILLAVEYGAMLGLHPMAALSGIHVIDGKPTLSAALMSALVHNAGHKLRIVTSGAVTGTGTNLGGDFCVEVTLVRKDDPQHPFVSHWNIDRAKRAGLWGKGNWSKYPENQMTWRGVSEVTKLGAPEVLSGVWYLPDELGATVDEDGDVIDAELVEQDHDGPNVTATMRDTKSGQTRPHNGKTEAHLRDSGATEPDPQPTAAPSGLPGRPRTDPVAGTADQPTRSHIDVWFEWAAVISQANDMASLINAHDDAVKRGVLDITGSKGISVEDAFLARRQELLDAAQQAAAGEPEPPVHIDGPEGAYDEVPF